VLRYIGGNRDTSAEIGGFNAILGDLRMVLI
jgi:hypothetical protein